MNRLILAAALAAAAAPSTPTGGDPACNGPVIDYTFHGYDGPTRIVSCGRFGYTGGRLTVDAYDPDTDGLFRNGFEAAP